MSKEVLNYDEICFSVLAYEFPQVDRKESEKKIKRKLSYHKAGKYDQQRVDSVRKLKDDLLSELSSPDKSVYYKKGNTGFCEFADFDASRMLSDFGKRYPQITEADLSSFIGLAINLYYMR